MAESLGTSHTLNTCVCTFCFVIVIADEQSLVTQARQLGWYNLPWLRHSTRQIELCIISKNNHSACYFCSHTQSFGSAVSSWADLLPLAVDKKKSRLSPQLVARQKIAGKKNCVAPCSQPDLQTPRSVFYLPDSQANGPRGYTTGNELNIT